MARFVLGVFFDEVIPTLPGLLHFADGIIVLAAVWSQEPGEDKNRFKTTMRNKYIHDSDHIANQYGDQGKMY